MAKRDGPRDDLRWADEAGGLLVLESLQHLLRPFYEFLPRHRLFLAVGLAQGGGQREREGAVGGDAVAVFVRELIGLARLQDDRHERTEVGVLLLPLLLLRLRESERISAPEAPL